MNVIGVMANLATAASSLIPALATQDQNQIAEAISPLFDIFSNFELKNTVEKVLWTYINNSFKNATIIALNILGPDKSRKASIRKISDNVGVRGRTLVIDQNLFSRPGASIMAKTILECLCQSLSLLDVDIEDEIMQIKLCEMYEWINLISIKTA